MPEFAAIELQKGAGTLPELGNCYTKMLQQNKRLTSNTDPFGGEENRRVEVA